MGQRGYQPGFTVAGDRLLEILDAALDLAQPDAGQPNHPQGAPSHLDRGCR